MSARLAAFLLPLMLAGSPLLAQPADKETDKKKEKWDVGAAPGPEQEIVVDTDSGTWMNLDVSPDGQRIVFDLLGDLYLLPIAGGEAQPLTSGSMWDMQPHFSPDGKEIAFTSDRDGGDNVWVVSLDGESTRQISREKFRLPNNPVWSPDGDYIAARKHFSSRRSLGSGEIWLWHRSGQGKGLQLNEKPNEQKDLGEPAFSPDGRYVYFSQDTTPGVVFEYSKDSNGQIYTIRRLDRETGEIETIVRGPGGAVRPTPSPDGRYLAFVRRVRFQSTLYLHDLSSGENIPLYGQLDRDMQEIWAIHGVYPNFAWTPDSRSLVFWAGGKIRLIDIETRAVREIPFHVRQTHRMKEALRFPVVVAPETFHTRALRWVEVSPTGDRVLFQTLGKIWARDLERDANGALQAGEPRRLTRQEQHFELYPSFSRDGRFVVYSTWHDEELGSVRIVAASGGEGRVLTPEPAHYVEPALSPDNRILVYRKATGGFLRSPLYSKEPGLYRVGLDPALGTPLDSEAGSPHRFADAGSEPHFGAASNRVFFTTRAGDQQVLASRRIDRPFDGDIEERQHLESKNATRFRVAPDSKSVLFQERFQAFVLPFVAASKPLAVGPDFSALPMRKVSRDAGDFAHFSGESGTIFWSLGPQLFEVDVAEALAPADKDTEETEGESGGVDGDQGDENGFEIPEQGLDLGFDVSTSTPTGAVAFVGARVVTMANVAGNDGVLENGTVVVEGNRIVAVGAADQVSVPADAYRVDARGKTLLPGILDVHWHGSQGTQGIQPQRNFENDATLAFGVTTAHDPSNDTLTFLAASELQQAGEIVGPRLFTTGTILYGAAGPFKAEVDSLEDARSHLRRLKAIGAFSVKSYNQPRRNQRQQIVAAARELEMMVVNEGGALFNHNMTMVMDGHTGIEHSLSVGAIYDDVRQYWGSTAVGNTPTLVVAFGGIEGERYWYQHTDVSEHERLLRFVPRPRVDARSRRRVMAPEGDFNHLLAAQVVGDLHDAGVSIQVGAHGQREGLGAHWEMWMFEQGGMSPMEVLRAGTIQGARYLGLDADLGSIEVGKLADLILIDGNPLEDLRRSEDVDLTMVNGRLFDAATMDEVGNHPAPRPAPWWQKEEGALESMGLLGGVQ